MRLIVRHALALGLLALVAACADPAPKTWPCAATRCEWRPVNEGAAQ